jgi:hypothetical protein
MIFKIVIGIVLFFLFALTFVIKDWTINILIQLIIIVFLIANWLSLLNTHLAIGFSPKEIKRKKGQEDKTNKNNSSDNNKE